MYTLVFDIETNAIKDFKTLCGLQTIHCIALGRPGEDPQILEVEDALAELSKADVLVGHNIMNFDIPAIKRLYPDWDTSSCCIRDTLVMSRMLWPDIQNEDWQIPEFPRQLIGRHSLKAWGYRMGILKDSFGDSPIWDEFTPEMAEYCIQDVRVTQALWDRIEKENPPENPTVLEHEFAEIISEQERNGFAFDVDAARKLHVELLSEKDSLRRELQSCFPAQVIKMKTPAYYENPITGERFTRKKDAPSKEQKVLIRGELRTKEIPFNPGSRDQIAKGLIDKYGWKPVDFTGEGKPKVDESVLNGLEYPEAKLMMKYLTVSKRLGQISDGRESWMKAEENGRIYGRVNPCGAVTTRCTHSRPNMAQVPGVHAPWGKECRSLFTVPEGYVLLGVDLSSLELRCLAHYTYKLDGGRYTNEVLSGDIHTANQEAAGLKHRNDAKVFIYAVTYGAGDAKIGSIIGGGRNEGRRLKEQFFRKMPALKKIVEAIKYRVKTQGHLISIDGRRLRIRSEHSALNTLLQSAGAIAVKQATCNLHRSLRSHGWGKEDVMQVAHIHDEIQLQVRKEIAEDVGNLSIQAIRQAGEDLGFRCPLDGEFKIGNNWAETH
tara:strand:- start:1914 stop:3728 length:1815 start_codon:yes stop_codon:yes gene_type:complete